MKSCVICDDKFRPRDRYDGLCRACRVAMGYETPATQKPHKFVRLPVSEDDIEQAKGIRRQRDKRYSNIFEPRKTDTRWCGDLGEIILNRWLIEKLGKQRVRWITDAPAGRPDFIACGFKIGLKTVKRKVRMRATYTAQISEPHAKEPVDDFFFACHETSSQTLCLVGGIPKREFLARATYYPGGAQVHASYRVPEGNPIYNIGVSDLTPPEEWVMRLRQSGGVRRAEREAR